MTVVVHLNSVPTAILVDVPLLKLIINAIILESPTSFTLSCWNPGNSFGALIPFAPSNTKGIFSNKLRPIYIKTPINANSNKISIANLNFPLKLGVYASWLNGNKLLNILAKIYPINADIINIYEISRIFIPLIDKSWIKLYG